MKSSFPTTRSWIFRNRILEAGKDEGSASACGLAARDSVRAGAVLPLSQQDIGPWAFVNNPWPFTLPKDEKPGNWTKNFFGRSALEEALASGNVTYTYAYCGFDPRKVTSPDHDTHPQVLLDGEVIGDVLTCVADVSIGRVDGVINERRQPRGAGRFCAQRPCLRLCPREPPAGERHQAYARRPAP